LPIDESPSLPSSDPHATLSHPSRDEANLSQEDARFEARFEFLGAVGSLVREDIEVLLSYAHYRMLRVRGRVLHSDAEDLLSEAIIRTRDGRRTWNYRNIPFRIHLIGCMSSIAYEWSKKGSKYVALSDTQASKYNLEAEVDAKLNVARLRQCLEDDSVALSVLETVMQGLTAKEAQESLNFNAHVYQAARKRLKRHYDRLFGPKQDKKRG
jgi:hypothetical protein